MEGTREYHRAQIRSFRSAGADMVSAITMNYAEEAIGIALAAKDLEIPCVISFTVETDGKLPSGEELGSAIARTDKETDGYPIYYMINCAHPSHFESVLDGDWTDRILGIRANSSCKSHAELDESTELDEGNPLELAQDYRKLRALLPKLKVFGGCCGTDHRHIEKICEISL
jgi:S-methylmethionine-dependent homocysteine/selenocysteine methylase